MLRRIGFYDPVQCAVITNECPWCRSVFSTRLDAQHHACSSFLHGSCRTGGSNVHTVIRQPQLPVECPLCKKTDAANHESKSLSPSCDESSLPKFSSVSDYYDHIIRYHLSLPAPPRERFAKVAQPCCNNTRTRRRGDKNEMARPLRPEECHRKPEAGRGLGAHLAIPG